ncbi:MAG TPA: HAMP domain-containing sensor histidine kinase [Solirubrobacterales bacterium]|nr:HAMP domain-containing sensor histidine kinase [Solirubrobacterales bacterium]
MTIELAQLAAGVPFAASLALAGGITTLREGRRRTALNEAMHELRRPLQVLSLSLPADRSDGEAVRSSLELTAAALERLDREINGEAAPAAVGPVQLETLLEAVEARWQGRAGLFKRSLRVRNTAGEVLVTGDRFGLSQALDNLINNALEHGTGQVTVEMRVEGRFASLAVRDSGRATDPKGGGLRARPGGRCRRGHGLRLVRRIAREHGGGFSFRSGSRGSVAILRLPLRGGER